ncbi:MAG: phenylacetate--CoA ligase [Oscillospiraceae bacterium]|jgi:phenylacetate-CoA ligase|nr:phenylacetate--CoA ligase [Oscillospiraceae bacterium]
MIFNPKAETAPRAEIERFQLEKLKHAAVYAYEKVPRYHAKFDTAKFDPYKIKTLGDIKYMPFTDKTDFRDTYPYGMLAVPTSKIARFHASSGTTGKPTVVGYTHNDIGLWAECVARIASAAGVGASDIVQISFGYGLFTGALGLHYGMEKIGAAVIPVSSGNTEKQIMLLSDLKATALVSTPSYAVHIGETAKSLGIDITKDFALKYGVLGSEGCTAEMRERAEHALNIFITDNYGMSELMGPGVSGECELRQGLHFNEDYFLPEIINPETLETLPEGAKGELIVTCLGREALPLLRYRTRDITSLDYTPCECGRTTVRMAKASGRTDDMLKIRGVNVFPTAIESVIMGTAGTAPHYEIIADRKSDSDTLEVKIEVADGDLLDSYSKLEKLRADIRHNLKSIIGLDVKVSLVEPKSITRYEGKAKRVFDLRK